MQRRGSNMLHWRYAIMTVLILAVTSAGQSGFTLKNESRLPWSFKQGGFISDWLVIGGFPNRDGKGYDRDYLQAHGGESKIEPAEGMTHALPDGSQLSWHTYESPYNHVNFMDVFKDANFPNTVAYVYATVDHPEGGKAVLSLGSTVGCKIWLNGELVFAKSSGGPANESNHVEVDMVAGRNSILVKSVHGGWTWRFKLRFINPADFSLLHDFTLSPSIQKTENDDDLVILTDRSFNPKLREIDARVEVVKAGGKSVASEVAKRGETVTFDTKKWHDGAYEIVLETQDTRDKLVTDYLNWYKGDAVKAAKALLATVPKNPAKPSELIHRMLATFIEDRLGENLSKADSNDLDVLNSPLMEFEELRMGQFASARANGFVRLAYTDDIDATPQFCRAYLPRKYDAKRKWPLVLNLHGYNGSNPEYVRWWSVDRRHDYVPDHYPIIYMEPHGRGNTGYEGIGERDILHCVEMAKQRFNVDEDRIYLNGSSMGGNGTWYVGSRHPDIFAAIAPVYGGSDYHVFFKEDRLAKLTARERFDFERNSSFAQVEALLTTPIFVIHGDADQSVDVEQSRYSTKMLQRWGYNIRYHEFPGYGHEGIDYADELMPWFLRQRRNARPAKVRIRAADLESASAHWVKVTQLDDPYAFVHVEAEILRDNTIRLSSENVLEIELSPRSPLVDEKQPITVIWNIQDIRQQKLKSGSMVLSQKDYSPAPLTKKPQLPGRLGDLTTTPFAIVIGTASEDSLMTRLCQQKARERAADWKSWQKYEPRVFLDSEMKDEQIAEFSLILFGDESTNLITRKLSSEIPLHVSSHEIMIAGRSFKVRDAFVEMLYPHPRNPARYVAVIAATSAAGMYFCNNANRDYDFLIQDGSVPNQRLGRPIDKLYVARGLFDHNWKLSPGLMQTGDDELRRSAPVRRVLPDLTTTIDNLPAVETAVYDSLAGKYQIPHGPSIAILREGDKLIGIDPNGQHLRLYPTSEMEYFADGEDVQLTFGKSAEGAKQVIIHVNNRDLPAIKVE